MEYTPILAYKDNYIWCIFDKETGNAVIIDPGDSEPVKRFIDSNNLNITHILITHHHSDHTFGVETLLQCYKGITVIAPKDPRLDFVYVEASNSMNILGQDLQVIDTKGHTSIHVSYYFKALKWIFTGDSLFGYNIGRLFEGTPENAMDFINFYKSLDGDVLTFPAHEYTKYNLLFNRKIHFKVDESIAEYESLRGVSITLPISINKQKKLNPMLNLDNHKLREDYKIYNDIEMLTYLRARRDAF